MHTWILFAPLALATPPAASPPSPPAKIVATKVEGVTLEKVKAATTPIDLATFDLAGKKFLLKCAGSTGQLACSVWDTAANTEVAASGDLKVCKDGNDVAIMTEKAALKGPKIVIPTGMFVGDPTKVAACGG